MKVVLMSSALVLLSACGGGATELAISMNDKTENGQMTSFYAPNQLRVTAGDKVKFNLSNAGTVPHNIRIPGPDGQYNTADDVLVGPQVVIAGASADFEWTAPNQAGTVEFRCDFHLNTGTITVE
jgi:plastocyanin